MNAPLRELRANRESPSYVAALADLPPELREIFNELCDDYVAAAFECHGSRLISPRVIAKLVLAGWRIS